MTEKVEEKKKAKTESSKEKPKTVEEIKELTDEADKTATTETTEPVEIPIEEIDAITGEIVTAQQKQVATVTSNLAVVSAEESLRLAMIAGKLFSSGLFPNVRSPEGAFTVIQYGRELGVGAVTALQNISIIQGKPACNGQLMLARALQKGVRLEVMIENEVACEIIFTRPNYPDYTAQFSMEEAKKAGLVRGGGGYSKYPKDMLYWRTIARGLRRIAPDVTIGLYTIEEMTNGMYLNVEDVPQEEFKEAKKADEKQGMPDAIKGTDKQRKMFHALCASKEIPDDKIQMLELFKKKSELHTKHAYSKWIDYLSKLKDLDG